MANTKQIFGLIAGAAVGSMLCILSASRRKTINSKKIAFKKGDWKDGTMDSFTGWLDRLQQGVDKEIKKRHT